MLREKGKYASATQNRRIVWAKIVWPLILELNDVSFTVKQYQKKRDEVSKNDKSMATHASRGMASLLQRGMIIKENNLYSIHFRLIPYLRLKADCDYSTAIHEVRTK